MVVPKLESELQLVGPTPQPERMGIPAASATYTAAKGNAGSKLSLRPTPQVTATPGNARSLTHQPATSWFLVGFVSPAPRRELPYHHVLKTFT